MDTTNLTETWMRNGACVGVGVDFFNLAGNNKARLQAICASCQETEACLEFALFEFQSEGMWAGTTPDQRKEMLRVSTDPRAVTARKKAARYNRHGEAVGE